MPRKDKTFKVQDIIRIFNKNLSNDEQVMVILYFYMIVPTVVGFQSLIIGRVSRKLQLILPKNLADKAISYLKQSANLMEKLPKKIVISIFEENSIKKSYIIKDGKIVY